MDPEIAEIAASKIPLLEQWPAVFVIITTMILIVLVLVTRGLTTAIRQVGDKIADKLGLLQVGVAEVKKAVEATNGKLDRNTDWVNKVNEDLVTELRRDSARNFSEMRKEAETHFAELRNDIKETYPPPDHGNVKLQRNGGA